MTYLEGLMGDNDLDKGSVGIASREGDERRRKVFDPSVLAQLPNKLQNGIRSRLNKFGKGAFRANSRGKETESSTRLEIDRERQLQAWRENPEWAGPPPEIKVSVPKGSLCNLSVKFDVGLPPDAIYDIVTDPDNRRVFKNIKEVISRQVLLDEGQRQVVELEQAAIWKFLWWTGTISVHVLVDQNREDLSMKFRQIKPGFMKKFEGCWRVVPAFVDKSICYPFEPKTWADYHSCTGGKGRIGSKVSLEQLIQPALVPPPPVSWYLRGITSRTTEMIAHDLLAEAARIRGDFRSSISEDVETSESACDKSGKNNSFHIKARWAERRRNTKRHQRRLSATM